MPRLNVRGSFGLVPIELTFTADDIDFTVDFPGFVRATVDYYPTGCLCLSAGGLFVTSAGDTSIEGEFTGSQEFGGNTYAAADTGERDYRPAEDEQRRIEP